MIIMVSVGMIFAILQEAIYLIHNRRVKQGKVQSQDGISAIVYVP
jgi:hypothetical protein